MLKITSPGMLLVKLIVPTFRWISKKVVSYFIFYMPYLRIIHYGSILVIISWSWN
jgi:hypothetical protein